MNLFVYQVSFPTPYIAMLNAKKEANIYGNRNIELIYVQRKVSSKSSI